MRAGEKMKKTIIYYAAIIIIATISCNSWDKKVNSPERNNIVFNQSIGTLEDSLLIMRKMLMGMPFEFRNNYCYYSIDSENKLYIDQSKLGNIDIVGKQNIKDSKLFENDEAFKDFIQMIVFLKDNHITSAFKEYYYRKNIMFDYRQLYGLYLGSTAEDDRYLTFIDDIPDTNKFFDKYKLLDRKGKLILVVPKLMHRNKE
jgi:hypothetical protein